jgi:hypothetical protein
VLPHRITDAHGGTPTLENRRDMRDRIAQLHLPF